MSPSASPRKRARRRAQGRPSVADAAALPQQILEGALRVFVSSGYGRATMDAIAREAGVSRKTLYARHANKAEVLGALVNHLLDSALAPHEEQIGQEAPLDSRRLLTQVGRELATLSSAAHVAGLNRLIFAEAVQMPELARLFGNLYERATDNVAASLAGLRGSGRLGRLADERAAAQQFIELAASLPRLSAMLGRPMSEAQLESHVRGAIDLFLSGAQG